MTTAAVIVGINHYAKQEDRLTSAVNDAVAFRDTLLNHNIVSNSQEIVMLTSPPHSSHLEATRDNIIYTLSDFYEHGDQINRFIFFFAGHGILTFTDAAHARTRTVLVPANVQDINKQGDRLIDFDEVLDFMRRAGPQEQFYIIDACRNFAWDKHPTVGVTGWSAPQTLSHERAQATLYAVSERGKALGQQNGMGVMTKHLLKALGGEGIAKVFDDASSSWVVTTQSVRDYLKKAIKSELDNPPTFMLPQLDAPDPQLTPIRFLQNVSDEPLVININPDESADDTVVAVKLRNILQDNLCLPPRDNHETIFLQPNWYRIEVSHPYLTPVPTWCNIDLREEHQVDIVIPIPGRQPPPQLPPPPPSPEIVPPTVHVSGPSSEGIRYSFTEKNTGRVIARAREPQVAIELESLEPPYKSWISYGELNEVVPVGPYRVRFRLGRDVFNESDIYVQEEDVNISATTAVTPLLREALSINDQPPENTVISESIGSIQAGVLQTLLPIIGIKPFDIADELFHRFTGVVETRNPAEFNMRPLSIVIALDGEDWGESATNIIENARYSLVNLSDYSERETIKFRPLDRTNLTGAITPNARGLDRIGMALTAAPADSFEILVQFPFRGIRLFSSSINNRATVVTITLRPNGSVDINQNLLRLPGRDNLYQNELVPEVSYGRMLRELQLGQQLYKSNELITERFGITAPYLIQDLFRAKWTDPVMSCMALYAWDEHSHRHPQETALVHPNHLKETAHNLHKFFGELPDSHLVYGLKYEDKRDFEFDFLLSNNMIPLLAQGTLLLARFAEERGITDHPVVRAARRLDVGQAWTSIFESYSDSDQISLGESENEYPRYF